MPDMGAAFLSRYSGAREKFEYANFYQALQPGLRGITLFALNERQG